MLWNSVFIQKENTIYICIYKQIYLRASAIDVYRFTDCHTMLVGECKGSMMPRLPTGTYTSTSTSTCTPITHNTTSTSNNQKLIRSHTTPTCCGLYNHCPVHYALHPSATFSRLRVKYIYPRKGSIYFTGYTAHACIVPQIVDIVLLYFLLTHGPVCTVSAVLEFSRVHTDP